MKFVKTKIPEVVIIEPIIYGDSRGYFFESFQKELFEKNVIKTNFIQDNESKSRYGVLRGLHFQKGIYSQSKLVRVIQGRVLDVAVDIRVGSPTYGQHVSVELSSENRRQLFIPRGFAHGFVVLSEEVLFNYKCDNYYHPEFEGGIAYNDPNLNIDWKIPSEHIILSEKDKNNSLLEDDSYFRISDNLYELNKEHYV